jgi:glutaredoxin
MLRRLLLVLLALAIAAGGCHRKKGGGGAVKPDDAPIVVRDSSDGLLLTWIDDKGDFHVEQKVSDVPMMGRDAVRVVDPNKDEGTHAGKVFVVDLRQAKADGTYPVSTMTREDFEKIAEARREKHGPTLATAASAAASATARADQTGGTGQDRARTTVIIYGASWCGACHEAAAYLRRKGIPFVEKDIEKDPQAAREMQAKLRSAGMHTGSIPVIDVRGKVMVGFNPSSIDDALGHAT